MDNFNLGDVTTYQAGAAQAAMHRLLQKLSDKILAPFGISKMQWMIIGAVLDAGKKGARISDVAETIGTTIPYLTNSINVLEKRGIMVRKDNAVDSRSKLVSISPSYLPTCKEIEDEMRRALRASIYAHIDRDEFIVYMKVMYQLLEVGKRSDVFAEI